MKRNVIKQGPSTLVISIPSKWAKKYGIERGMQLNVENKGRALVVTTDSLQEGGRKRIPLLNSDKDYVWRELSAAYIAGYSEIEIEYSDQKVYEFLEQYVLTTFVGFEITEHKKNSCTLKQILHENPGEFETIMRRIFLTLLHVSEQFLSILETGKNHEAIFPLERTNNRQTYYLKRILTKEGFRKPEKTTFAAILIHLLEQVMNQYKYCTWAIQKKTKKGRKETVDYYLQVHNKLQLIYEFYFSYSQSLFEKIKNKTVKIDSRIKGGLDILKNDPEVVKYIMTMIEHYNDIVFQIHGINS